MYFSLTEPLFHKGYILCHMFGELSSSHCQTMFKYLWYVTRTNWYDSLWAGREAQWAWRWFLTWPPCSYRRKEFKWGHDLVVLDTSGWQLKALWKIATIPFVGSPRELLTVSHADMQQHAINRANANRYMGINLHQVRINSSFQQDSQFSSLFAFSFLELLPLSHHSLQASFISHQSS